jgi:hypothetical protein
VALLAWFFRKGWDCNTCHVLILDICFGNQHEADRKQIKLRDVISQKTESLIVTTVKTSHPIFLYFLEYEENIWYKRELC